MKKDWFEKLLKDSYHNEDISLSHHDRLWNNIQKRKESKKKIGFLSAYFKGSVMLGVFFILLGGMYYLREDIKLANGDKSVNESYHSNYDNSQKSDSELKDPNSEGSINPVSSNGIVGNKEDVIQLRSASPQGDRNISPATTTENEHTTAENISQAIIEKTALKKTHIDDNITTPSQDRALGDKVNANIIHPNINTSRYNPISKQNNLNEALDRKTKRDRVDQTTIIIERNQYLLSKLPSSPIHPLSHSILLNPTKVNISNNTVNNIPSPEIGITYGIGFNSNSLKAINPELDDYLDKRRLNEDNRYTSTIGMGLKIFISPNFFIQSGISYEHIIYRFTDRYDQIRFEERDGIVVEILKYGDGSTEEILGTGNVKITESVQVQNINDLKTVYLPISLGYRNNSVNGFNIQTSLGMRYGIYTTADGFTHAVNGSLGDYAQLSDLGYGKTNPIDITFDLSIQKYLGNNYSLVTGVGGSFDLKSRTNLTGISDKYNNYAVRMALFYVID